MVDLEIFHGVTLEHLCINCGESKPLGSGYFWIQLDYYSVDLCCRRIVAANHYITRRHSVLILYRLYVVLVDFMKRLFEEIG